MDSRKHQKHLLKMIERYLQGEATAEERTFVEQYYGHFERRAGMATHLTDEEKQAWKEQLMTKIKMGIAETGQAPVIPVYRRLYFKIAAAAAILIMVIGVYRYFGGPVIPPVTAVQPAVENDILPGTAGATLVLANGKKVLLDSTQNGLLAKEGNTVITNTNGQLAYQPGAPQETMQYNTIMTHKGEQYALTLGDGTRIIVDASTTLRFPVAFTGTERVVSLNGRAWFEVAKDVHKPFWVVKGDQKVQVLGTQFDVSAFDNEADLKVTLVEGRVQVTNGPTRQMLNPGQQAVVSLSTDKITLIQKADVEAATAWKNGLFVFHNARIETILRDIERWYDVDVEIKQPLPDRTFFLEGSRHARLSELLRGFEVNHIPYTIDSQKRKLIVNP